MDLATATGRKIYEVTIGGEAYRVSALAAEDWADFQEWIRIHIYNPMTRALRQLDEAEAAGVRISKPSREAMLEVARKASRSWPPKPGTAEWVECLQEDGADGPLFWVALRKHNPGMTREKAAELAGLVDADGLWRLGLAAVGGDPDDPKAATRAGLSPARPTGGPSSPSSSGPGDGARDGSAS
jgi:hypothetical protein